MVVRACVLWLAVLLAIPARSQEHRPVTSTFTNPLLPSGADPSVIYRDGFYYYMQTTGTNLTIWKTRDITDLRDAKKKVVWTPLATGPYSHQIWAPELHFLEGKWYIYFAADSGANETHRIWVLENASPDPLEATWTMKGKLAASEDKRAIDPTVFQNHGKLYAVWSGWQDDVNGEQDIYIARMKNPWTIEGRRALISKPTFPWEEFGDLPNQKLHHVSVNEGPEVLRHAGKIFLIYSASGCWTDHYALGMLTASADSDPLNPAAWRKATHIVFSGSPPGRRSELVTTHFLNRLTKSNIGSSIMRIPRQMKAAVSSGRRGRSRSLGILTALRTSARQFRSIHRFRNHPASQTESQCEASQTLSNPT